MRDSVTVFRKEVLDMFGSRHSLRGPLWQLGVTVLLTGLVVPAADSSLWTHLSAPLVLYAVFPAGFAAALAADSFAGEIERGTLETLLATPLANGAIFLGKTALAVLFVLCVAGLSLAVAIPTAYHFGRVQAPIPLGLFFGVLGGAVACAFLIAALTIAVSTRVPVARSAHQIGMLITFLVAGLTSVALETAGRSLGWTGILWIDACGLLLGAATLLVAGCSFRRESLFDRR